MRIDAHQHFWRISRGDYGWLTPEDHPAICRDFGPDDLALFLIGAGIEKTVLVQAAPTEAETLYLLDLAELTPFVAGVVGWADLEARDAPAAIERLALRPKLIGLRPMLQDMEDPAWILGQGLAPALRAMRTANLTLDALIQPRHLPYISAFLTAHSDLKVVIDHGAKPNIAGGALADWGKAMRRIGKDSGACCKLSGLVTEAGPDWTVEQLKPCVDVLLEAFGPRRLIWGSDWPVVNLAGGFSAWRAAAEALTEACSPEDRDWIFGRTAQAFYGIEA
jgi:L-fuconolactonase